MRLLVAAALVRAGAAKLAVDTCTCMRARMRIYEILYVYVMCNVLDRSFVPGRLRALLRVN